MTMPLTGTTAGAIDPLTGQPYPPGYQQPGPGVTINVGDPARTEPDPEAPISRAQLEEILNAERERVRQEEKDKLYPTIEELRTQTRTLTEEREQRLEAEAEEQQRLAEEARLAQEAEMDVTTRFDSYRSEMDQRFAELEEARQRDAALLERERMYGQLQAYRAERIAQEANDIAPQFVDYIGGNTQEEIEASIASAKTKTAEIVQQFNEAQLQGRRTSAPPIAGAPPVDPTQMTGEGQTQELSPEEIRNMTMAEYGQYRSQLLGASSQRVRERGAYAP